MMGRGGSSSTIGAMHFGSAILAVAVGQAIQEGIHRGRDLKSVDDAHSDGQAYYNKRIRQRRAAALTDAANKKARLLAGRKMLHG